MIQPFCPQYKSNQILTAAVGALTATINKDADQIRMVNAGANVVYVCVYDSTGTALTATTADFPVFANQAVTITKSLSHDRLSYMSPTGTTLHVMTGEGF